MTIVERAVIASKNPDKIGEIEAVLTEAGVVGAIVRGLDWDEIDETGSTLEANALLKARAVHSATGLPAIADDTGLEVEALDGAPGVRTARFAGADASYSDNVDALLRALDGEMERTARFRTVIACSGLERGDVTAEGVLVGRITTSRRGQGGFGYDPIFEVDGRTLAEMPIDEKNRISHRARAIRALTSTLADRPC